MEIVSKTWRKESSSASWQHSYSHFFLAAKKVPSDKLFYFITFRQWYVDNRRQRVNSQVFTNTENVFVATRNTLRIWYKYIGKEETESFHSKVPGFLKILREGHWYELKVIEA